MKIASIRTKIFILLVEGKKMSKSLGNFFTLRDLLAKGFTGREVRYLLLSAHYRDTFNFTLDGLSGAKSALARIDECVGKLCEIAASGTLHESGNSTLIKNFTTALDNDLNISAAWAAVFEWVRETNKLIAKKMLTADEAQIHLKDWGEVQSVLGIPAIVSLSGSASGTSSLTGTLTAKEAPTEIIALLEARQVARKEKNFKRSDKIRDELKDKGWGVEDSPKGPKLKKI